MGYHIGDAIKAVLLRRIRSGVHCLLPPRPEASPHEYVHHPYTRHHHQADSSCASYILLRQYVARCTHFVNTLQHVAHPSQYVHRVAHTPISNYVTRRCKGRTVSMELNHHQPHCWQDNSYHRGEHHHHKRLSICATKPTGPFIHLGKIAANASDRDLI